VPVSEGEAKKYRGDGRVSFLAHLESFKKEIQEGWSIQAVYERYADKLDISYPQFVRYVRRYITGPVSEPEQAKPEKSSKANRPAPVKEPKTRLSDSASLPDSELF
jgi:hypothetical protein